MGIIRAIKNSELGGDNDEPIYPVTSVRAIYDLNNVALEAIIEEQKASINNNSTKASALEVTLSEVSNDVNNIKGVLKDLQDNVSTILNTVLNLESAVAEKNNQNNYIVAKVTVSSAVTRGTPENINNNLECYSPVKNPLCIVGDLVPFHLLNMKDGEILIPTKPGTYILDNKEIEVIDYSLIQKQGEDFVVISLGIPMPPHENGVMVGGKVLTTSEGGLYWA